MVTDIDVRPQQRLRREGRPESGLSISLERGHMRFLIICAAAIAAVSNTPVPAIAASLSETSLLQIPAPFGGVPSGEDPALTLGSPSADHLYGVATPPSSGAENGSEPATTGSLGAAPTLRGPGLGLGPVWPVPR